MFRQPGGVREALFQLQRMAGEQGGVVLEGRDIGTVVFPDARGEILPHRHAGGPRQQAVRRVVDAVRVVDYARTLEEVLAATIGHHAADRAASPSR